MTIIEDYLDRSPEQAKRIIGINLDQFQELVKQAEVIHHQKQPARPRLIQGGGGRRRKLSVKQEILRSFSIFKPISHLSNAGNSV